MSVPTLLEKVKLISVSVRVRVRARATTRVRVRVRVQVRVRVRLKVSPNTTLDKVKRLSKRPAAGLLDNKAQGGGLQER